MSENDCLVLTGEIKQRLDNGLIQLNSASQEYTIAFQNSSNLVSGVDEYKEHLKNIDDYTSGKISVPNLLNKFGSFDEDERELNGKIDENYTELATICTLYLGVSQTIVAMLDATEQILSDANTVDIAQLLSSYSLDALFEKYSEEIVTEINSYLEDGKKISTDMVSASASVAFSGVFGAIFGDSIASTMGYMVGTEALSSFWGSSRELSDVVVSTLKQYFKQVIKDNLKSIIIDKGKAGNNLFTLMIKDVEQSKLNLGATAGVAGVTTFAVTFLANVIMDKAKDGKVDWLKAAISAGESAAVSTLSSIVVSVTMSSLGFAPTTLGLSLVAAAATAILTFVGNKALGKIEYLLTHYGDGVPGRYEHLTNEQILEMLRNEGLTVEVPKYGDKSVYQITAELAKKGASDELLVVAFAGAGVPVNVEKLKENPKVRAIIDYFYNLVMDPSFCNDPEYLEQMEQLKELFGLFGDPISDETLSSFVYDLTNWIRNDGSSIV